MPRRLVGSLTEAVFVTTLDKHDIALLILSTLFTFGGAWSSCAARTAEGGAEKRDDKLDPISSPKQPSRTTDVQPAADQKVQTARNHTPNDSTLPPNEIHIRSLEDRKNDPVPKDWSRLIVGKFRANSEYWPLLKKMAGVEVLFGKPSEIRKGQPEVFCGNRKVFLIWIYTINDTGKPIRLDDKDVEDAKCVSVGFDEEGNVLYCARIANIVE